MSLAHADHALIARAEAFARAAHQGRARKGAAREPYDTHLAEVADFVTRHGGDAVTIAATWLHDTVEDCAPVTAADIAAVFGPLVAAVVAELTDDKSLPKPERKRLQQAHAPGRSSRAALVKLGDKTSNVRGVALSSPVHWDAARQAAYLDWAEAVAAALPPGHGAARAELAAALQQARAALAG